MKNFIKLALFWGLMQFSILANADIVQGVNWLSSNYVQNGGYGNEADIATNYQSTVEAIKILQARGETVPDDVFPYVESQDYLGTEYLVRKINTLTSQGQDVSELYINLIASQNEDGGFGEHPGYSSTSLDTGFALLGLAASTEVNTEVVSQALGYLQRTQQTDGSWELDGHSESEKYVTLIVLEALNAWKSQFQLSNEIHKTSSWLLSQLSPSVGFGSTMNNALGLTQLLQFTTDTRVTVDLLNVLHTEQLDNGSWNNDVYLTALALQALSFEAEEPEPVTTGSISGVVSDEATGLPIESIIVTYGESITQTDAQGGISFVDLPPGVQSIEFRGHGYQTRIFDVTVEAGQTTRLGNVDLTPVPLSATLKGVVTNANNLPISGAIVSVGTNSTSTQADGHYLLNNVSTGVGQISVIKPGYQSIQVEQNFESGFEYNFSPTLYSSTQPPPTTASLTLTVLDAETGAPLEGVTASVRDVVAESGLDGSLDFTDLVEGEFTLVLELAGYRSIELKGVLVVGMNNGGSVSLSPLPQYSQLSGIIHDAATDEPIPGAYVSVVGSAATFTTDASGAFELVDLEDTEFQLQISADQYLSQTLAVSLPEAGNHDLGIVTLAKVQEVGLSLTRFESGKQEYLPSSVADYYADVLNATNSSKSLLLELEVQNAAGELVETIVGNRGLTGADGRPVNLPILVEGNTEVESEFHWLLQNYPAGEYTATIKGYVNGQVAIEQSSNFSVAASPVLLGSVSVDPPLVQFDASTEVNLSAEFKNAGNLSVQPGALDLQITVEGLPDTGLAQTRVSLKELDTDASIYALSNIAVDSSGNSYVVSSDRLTILKVSPAGTSSEFYSMPIFTENNRQTYAYQVDIDSNGYLYVAAYASGRVIIYVVSPSQEQLYEIPVQDITSSSRLKLDAISPNEIYLTGSGSGGWKLLKVAIDSEEVLATNGLYEPQEMIVTEDGDILVTNYNDGSLSKVDPATGSITAFVSGLSRPRGIALGPDGNYYVADSGAGTVVKVTPLGEMSDFATGLNNPVDLDFDTSGQLFVSSPSDAAIYKILLDGSIEVFSKGVANRPMGLAADASDNIFIANTDGTLRTLNTNSNSTSILLAGLNSPRDLELDANGDVYVAEYGGGTITKYVNGLASTFVDGLQNPFGVAIDDQGGLAVSTRDAIELYDELGIPTQTLLTPLYSPSDMVEGENGDIFIRNNNFISKVNTNGISRTYTHNSSISAMEFDYSSNSVVFSDSARKLNRLNQDGSIELIKDNFYSYAGLGVDVLGQIYFVDVSNRNAIHKIEADGSISTNEVFSQRVSDLQSGSSGLIVVRLADRTLHKFRSGETSSAIPLQLSEYIYGHEISADDSLIVWTNRAKTYQVDIETGTSAVVMDNLLSTTKQLLTSGGGLYASTSGAHTVSVYDQNQGLTNTYYGFSVAYDIDWDASLQQYLIKTSNGLYSISSGGETDLIKSSLSGEYIYRDNLGDTYTGVSNRVYKLDSTGVLTSVAISGGGSLRGVAQTSEGIIAADNTRSRLIQFTQTNTIEKEYGGLTQPWSIAFNDMGELLVGDRSNGIIGLGADGQSSYISSLRPTNISVSNGSAYATYAGSLYQQNDQGEFELKLTDYVKRLENVRDIDGTIFALDSRYDQLIELQQDAWVVKASGLASPVGVAKANESIYVVNESSETLVKFDVNGLSVVSDPDLKGVKSLTNVGDKLYAGTLRSMVIYDPVNDSWEKTFLPITHWLNGFAQDGDEIVAVHYNGALPDILRIIVTEPVPPAPIGTVVYETSQDIDTLNIGDVSDTIDFGSWIAPYPGDFRVQVGYAGIDYSASNTLHVGGHVQSELVVLNPVLPAGDSQAQMCLNLTGADFDSISKVEVDQVRAVTDSPRPLGLSADKQGNVYFTEYSSFYKVVDKERILIADNLGTIAYGVGVDEDERFYIATKPAGDTTYHLLRISQAGEVTDLLDLDVSSAGGIQVNNRNEIVIGTTGKLIVVSQEGAVSEVGVPRLAPKQISIDGKGNVYAQNADDSVVLITPEGNTSMVFDYRNNPNDPLFEGDGYPTITADCADNLYLTFFRWAEVEEQQGEEHVLVQYQADTKNINMLFDAKTIDQSLGDIDYLSYDRFGQRILMWNEYSRDRIWQVPVTCGAISADAHLFTKPDQKLTAQTKAENASLVGADERTEYVWSLQNITAQGESICFDANIDNLELGEQRTAIDSGYITFSNTFSEQDVNVPLIVPFVFGTNIVDISISTDKVEYIHDEVVSIYTNLSNARTEDVQGELVLTIVDEFDVELENINLGQVTISASDTLEVVEQWDTRDTLTGSYHVIARLLEEEHITAEARTIFEIVQEAGVEIVGLRVTTDKPQYHTTDQVILESLASNLSQNILIDNAELVTKVYAPNGVQIAEFTEPLNSFGVGSVVDQISNLVLNDAEPGIYSVIGEIIGSEGQILATDTAGFMVDDDLSRALQGTVTVALETLTPGDQQTCTDTIQNTGTANLDNQLIRQIVVDLNTSFELVNNQLGVNLPVDEPVSMVRNVATSGLSSGVFACVLQAQVEGDWITLGYDSFTLTVPPIDIEGTLEQGSNARLLVLLDGITNNGANADEDPHGPSNAPLLSAQRSYLEDILAAKGWSYTIVTDEGEFTEALRSGNYSAYVLFSEQVKLSEQVQKELREAAFRGEGLLIAGDHDHRHNKLDEALGVNAKGRLQNPTSISIDSVEDFQPGSSTFSLSEKVRRIELQGANSIAQYPGLSVCDIADDSDDDSGTSSGSCESDAIAVTHYDYGFSHNVYAGFDLLAQAALPGADPLFTELLLDALEDIQPDSSLLLTGSVIPVNLTLTNQGIATPGQALVTLPEGGQIMDSGVAAVQADGSLLWSFDLAEDASETLVFWLRLPELAGPAYVEALIQVGIAPDLTDHDTVLLTLALVQNPGLLEVMDELSILLSQYQDFFDAYERVVKALNYQDQGRFDKALKEALKAADHLATLEHSEATIVRQNLGFAIRQLEGQLQ